jgi:hypothetical protein
MVRVPRVARPAARVAADPLRPPVHGLAQPMRSSSPSGGRVGRRAGVVRHIAAERCPTTARPKGDGRVV